MDLGLDGKRVLVTGSTSGIGLAIAEQYLAEGASVVVQGLTEAETCFAVENLSGGTRVCGISADVSTSDGIRTIAEFALRDGPLDILVNNVGVYKVAEFATLSDEAWSQIFDINVFSAVRLARILLPLMLERGTGSIINIASEAGVKPLRQMIHYSVSKTALIGLNRALAELTKGTRVHVNAILPGPTWTEGVRRYFEEFAAANGRSVCEVTSDYFSREEPTSLIQRFVQPEEVARLVVFVSAAEAMNGGAYRIEGGIIRSIL